MLTSFMIVNLNLFQNKYFVLTYLNYCGFSGQTAIVFSGVNGRYLELKCEIERWVVMEERPRICLGWGKMAVAN